MSKLGRKIRRQAAKRNKKMAEKEVAEKVALFDKIPEVCLICNREFNKKDKEMVTSWYVIVRKEEAKVNLYCPPCWDSAMATVHELQNQIKGDKNDS